MIHLDKGTNRTCEDFSRLGPSQCWLPKMKSLCDDLKYLASFIETEPSEENLFSTSSVIDVMCRRVRLQVEDWVHMREEDTDCSIRESIHIFSRHLKQTQMCQRYHDDNHIRHDETQIRAVPNECMHSDPNKEYQVNDLHDSLLQIFEMALY